MQAPTQSFSPISRSCPIEKLEPEKPPGHQFKIMAGPSHVDLKIRCKDHDDDGLTILFYPLWLYGDEKIILSQFSSI